jgi:hypothetical protein
MTQREFNALLRYDFGAFVAKGFATLNPGAILRPNWHIDAITHALKKVMAGDTKRLIINAPPRCLKSIISSVALPAFLLGLDPTRKIICASYSETLAIKHASDCRRIMLSDWYASAFGTPQLVKDTETELTTEQGGYRLTTSVGGTLTGRGGDLIIIDDPMNATDAMSEASRRRVADWFNFTVQTRLDDPKLGAIVIVMQRLHHEDLTGVLL